MLIQCNDEYKLRALAKNPDRNLDVVKYYNMVR